MSGSGDLNNLTDEDLCKYAKRSGLPAEINELIRRYNNKKAECERLNKLAYQRTDRLVQLHSRNMELKEQIYKALRALSPNSSET